MGARGRGASHATLFGRRWIRALSVPAAAVLAACTLVQGSSWAAASSPYTSASGGFDISYPNCSATLPSGDSFAIVGVGGGRPFTTNGCAAQEWSAAAAATGGSTPSLYFNTGYSGAYSRHVDNTCASAVSKAGSVFSGLTTSHARSQAETAWEVGCSEADFAAANEPAGSPTMWWADVETGNSWSTNVSLNQYALDGMSYWMQNVGGGGGFYSTPGMWAGITGNVAFQPLPPASANWVAGGSCGSSPAFAGTPTWLVQGGTSSGVDADLAC